jgi:hypothetical protein
LNEIINYDDHQFNAMGRWDKVQDLDGRRITVSSDLACYGGSFGKSHSVLKFPSETSTHILASLQGSITDERLPLVT